MAVKKPAAQANKPEEPFKITQWAIDNAPKMEQRSAPDFQPFRPMPGVIPEDKKESALAMDATPYDVLNNMSLDIDYATFFGYPALATLAQQVEYSNLANVFADEMVRNWICIRSTEDADDERIEQMQDALDKWDVKRLIHRAVYQDAVFGVSHIFVDTGSDPEDTVLPLILDPRAIKKDSLNGFRTVDPTWVYPAMYNTRFPLKKDFYKPTAWYVMGQTVHESRFIDLVSRPVPDILKPSYNFGGLALTQMMEPYVRDWRDVKYNISAVIRSMRMRVIMTDMQARLQAGDFDKRLQLLVKYQDNMGIAALDKTTEELVHTQTSLSELSNLLSNYQEQLCIPARITNLKLLGNAPAGLNASGDAELETWHETISGYQDAHLKHVIDTIFKIIQLNEFGEILPEIYFEFNPLDEMSEEDTANVNKTKVETIIAASDGMAISTEEARSALRAIEGAGFEDLPEENPIDEGEDLESEDDLLNFGKREAE